MIPLTRPTLPPLKKLAPRLNHILKSGMLTNSKFVAEFEKKCASFLNVNYVDAVVNGTAALMLAVKCLGLKGEVIVPSFTYTSTGHILLWNNLEPVFVDIDLETFNIDPALIEKKITKKTSAILATHVFGNPCDIDTISKIAKKHKLKVIYDAAHAFGANYKGKSVASYGDVSIFSFSPTKIITTGEGGLAVCHNKKLAHRINIGKVNGDSYDQKEEFLGISARMSEMSAILGIESLRVIKKTMLNTRKLVQLYYNELSEVPGIKFQKLLLDADSSYKAMAMVIDKNKFGISRDQLLKKMSKNNIQAKVYFTPLHKKKVYKKYKNISLPNTDYLYQNIISLPLYSHMSRKDIKKVCSLVKKFGKK